mmetsp:Transcript_10436/g.15498  ORF Transcript_10436/g.15498 Transcript_10436/m.15498 type:complete len:188 (-) Transcript_10436:2221-2784(-)
MFKRFSTSDCSTSTQIKSSAQRGIKAKIQETFPGLDEAMIDVLLPKKPPLVQYKATGLTIFCTGGSENVPLFYQHRDWDDVVLPTLKFVHKYPDLPWTKVTVDKGAIPFVLGGANIMCPGLTNPGGEIEDGLQKGQAVIIMAEGKEHAIAVGKLKISSEDIRTKNKGIGIEVAHYLGDKLFELSEIC